jgi:hypothetical protein
MQHGKPYVVGATSAQPDTREGQAGRHRVAERPVVPLKPGNAGGGKGPWFKASCSPAGAGGAVLRGRSSIECSSVFRYSVPGSG